MQEAQSERRVGDEGSLKVDAEDDPTVVREGPVRLLQAGSWKRKNGPAACDLCRQRRVRCSGFETGAPCDSCIRRQAYCTFGCDSYAPTAPERTVIFIAILPPPAGPSSTPLVPDQPCAPLDIDALSVKLSDSGPRPAPLVWIHPLDSMQDKAPARQLRARGAPAVASNPTQDLSDEEEEEERPDGKKAAPTAQKRKRSLNATYSTALPTSGPATGTHRPPKGGKITRARLRTLLPSLQRFTPLEPPRATGSASGLAVLAYVGAKMLDIEAWKTRDPACAPPAPKRQRKDPTASFPTSYLRGDDMPAPPHLHSSPLDTTFGPGLDHEDWISSTCSSRRVSNASSSSSVGWSVSSTSSLASSGYPKLTNRFEFSETLGRP
ncbi:hypothetical protein JCM8202_000608 [Rhodotorula sphaerocarpa]